MHLIDLQGRRVLITQSDDFMGPALARGFSALGAAVTADARTLARGGVGAAQGQRKAPGAERQHIGHRHAGSACRAFGKRRRTRPVVDGFDDQAQVGGGARRWRGVGRRRRRGATGQGRPSHGGDR